MLFYLKYPFQRQTFRSLSRVLLILMAMTALVYITVGRYERDQLLSTYGKRMVTSSALRAEVFAVQLDRIRSDAHFLSGIQSVLGLTRALNNNGVDPEGRMSAGLWKQRLESTFSEFVSLNPNITQLRFIGMADYGRELVRVDRRNGQIYVVPSGELQPKGDREYFQETAKLHAGQVSVSQINLNREHGEIERPFVRTIRTGAPVFGTDGKLFGMVVINFSVQFLLDSLKANSANEIEIFLLNNAGDYLLHPDTARTFGFDLGKRWRWQDEYTASNPGVVSQPDGLQEFSSPSGTVYAVLRQIVIDPNNHDRDVTIVVAVPDSAIAGNVANARLRSLLVMLGASLLTSMLVYFYQRQRIRVNEKQAELAAIVESSRDAIIGKTLDGIVTSWNPGAEILFGYAAGEAIGKELTQLIVPPDFVAEEKEILNSVSQGAVISAFNTIRSRADCSLLDVSITVSPIRSVDGIVTGAAQTVRDISTQKAFETQIQALNKSLEHQVAERTAQIREFAAFQRVILEYAGFSMIATDRNGVITLFNPAAERMLGYRADEMIGKKTPALWHDKAEVAARTAALALELGEEIGADFNVFVVKTDRGLVNECEWTYIRKDGRRLPVLVTVTALRDELGMIFGYLGISADLSERRAAEQALEANNRFLDTLTNNIPSMVCYWDSDLRCRYANRAYLEWFGRSADDVEGMSVYELFTPEFLRQSETYIAAALGGQAQHFERHVEAADGSTTYAQTHYIPDIVGEKVRGFVVLVSDVTDLKNAQLTLEQLNEKLQTRTLEAESANQAKSEFLANMSHEIRTPMNAVLGMLQLMQQTALNARQIDYASKAETAARALLGILNDILDFSRVEAGKLTLDPHPFSIDQLLRDIAVILSSGIGNKNVEVLFEIDPAIPDWIRGDALRLQQVLINLAGNAIKFTARGEVVLIARLTGQTNESVSINFAVRDTGIGISAEQSQRIFEGFSQAEASTARRYGGSGLGLAISQRLVKLMGGQIELDSKVGHGSKFYFSVDFDIARPSDEIKPRSIPKLHNLYCLVVDDNSASRQIMKEMLMSFGWKVDLAGSGHEALTVLARRGAEFTYDVIFVDWRMPDMDGWETCERIRKLLTPEQASLLVMVTAHGRELYAQRQTKTSDLLDGVIVKPVMASMLFNSVADFRAKSSHRDPLEPIHLAAQQRLTGMRILVVDDNETNQQVAYELLSNDGALVKVSDGGRAAIAAIKEASPQFDVVLMDVQMPDMDGYAATREIRQVLHLYTLPVIAITANVLESDRHKSIEAGMNDHVGKPFNLSQLISVIQRHTGRVVTAQPTGLDAGANKKSVPAADSALFALDSENALLRLGGNRQLYQRILRNFSADLSGLQVRLDKAISEGKTEAIARILHSLKGLAGTAGAVHLADCAKQAEQTLRLNPDMGTQLADDLQMLLDAVPPALDALAATLQKIDNDIGATIKLNEYDRLSLKTSLEQLQGYLRSGNLEAMAACEILEKHIGPMYQDQFDALADSVQQLNFSKALQQCSDLIHRTEEE